MYWVLCSHEVAFVNCYILNICRSFPDCCMMDNKSNLLINQNGCSLTIKFEIFLVNFQIQLALHEVAQLQLENQALETDTLLASS